MTDQIPKPVDEQLEAAALNVMRSLYERHDAFKGSFEPVYGKRYAIADPCRGCGTHFKGLENDIKLLFKHYAKDLITQSQRKLLDEVAEHSREYGVSDAERYEHRTGFDGQEMVPLSVIEELRRKL